MVAAIAARQRGLVTLAQLRAACLSDKAIVARVRSARLHRVHRGVYLVGHAVMPPLAHEMAAVLACGDGAVLSHRSAAGLWQLVRHAAGPVDVTTPGRRVRSRPGIRVHRSAPLPPRDFRRRNSIPVTAPARTLLDLAEIATLRQLERAFDEALTQRVTSERQLRELLARSPGRHGTAALTALVERTNGPTLTRSDLEELTLALVRRAGLPEPELNVVVHGFELDLFWRPQRLDVEIDGRRYHSLPRKVEADRRRDADLQAAGIRVMRIGEGRIVGEPEWVVARVAQALSA